MEKYYKNHLIVAAIVSKILKILYNLGDIVL